MTLAQVLSLLKTPAFCSKTTGLSDSIFPLNRCSDWHTRNSKRLKPVVSISARDTEHPVREVHSTTPVWPGADYTSQILQNYRYSRYYRYSKRLKPVVSISARDTEHPVREVHSTTLVWPGADYTFPECTYHVQKTPGCCWHPKRGNRTGCDGRSLPPEGWSLWS
jgi:hypothetical protein